MPLCLANARTPCLRAAWRGGALTSTRRGAQFSLDVRVQLADAMEFRRYATSEVIAQQGGDDGAFYLVISGSVALHRLEGKGGQANGHGQWHGHARGGETSGIIARFGRCARVLGVGDSFGELSFVQGRAHPTTAVVRTECACLVIDGARISPVTRRRIAMVVENPQPETMDEVFAKAVEDRNEKDIMLLVNYLEKNPFFAGVGYARLLDCASSVTRQTGSARSRLARPSRTAAPRPRAATASPARRPHRALVRRGGSRRCGGRVRGLHSASRLGPCAPDEPQSAGFEPHPGHTAAARARSPATRAPSLRAAP